MIAAQGRPWSKQDIKFLRDNYPAQKVPWLAEQLGRTESSIVTKLWRLGLVRDKRWSQADDRMLFTMWGEHTVERIATTMGRTPWAVMYRARRLGYGIGCPQGVEYLSQAAARTGLSTCQIRGVLRWGGCRIDHSITIKRPGVRHRRCVVDPTSVDEAVAKWCESETLGESARRHGYDYRLIRDILLAAMKSGDQRVHRKPRRCAHWRNSAKLVDELVAAWEAARGQTETLREAAARHRVHNQTISRVLRSAGFKTGPGIRVLVADVDRVMAERKALATPQELGRWRGCAGQTALSVIRKAAAAGQIEPPIKRGGEWLVNRKAARRILRKWTPSGRWARDEMAA